nr:sce7725 family protein [Arthrobacter silviterrae]
MYYPYLRGKQFELLAIKELADVMRESKSVHPVIEPVRDVDSSNTLLRNMAVLAQKRVPSTVIINPQVGEIKGTNKSEQLLATLRPILDVNPQMKIGIILSNDEELVKLTHILNHQDRQFKVDLFYGSSNIQNECMNNLSKSCDVDIHFAEDKYVTRRYRSTFPTRRTALLRDSFARQIRNQDYFTLGESIFSEDHLFFREDNYVGFGDFQTIGSQFNEGGALPRVVAIHLTYQRPNEEAIYIRHFCSTPNGSSADTAGKYFEALTKLVTFVDENRLDNSAIATFRSHLTNRSYAGLGVIKKLSIQNHIYVALGAENND